VSRSEFHEVSLLPHSIGNAATPRTGSRHRFSSFSSLFPTWRPLSQKSPSRRILFLTLPVPSPPHFSSPHLDEPKWPTPTSFPEMRVCRIIKLISPQCCNAPPDNWWSEDALWTFIDFLTSLPSGVSYNRPPTLPLQRLCHHDPSTLSKFLISFRDSRHRLLPLCNPLSLLIVSGIPPPPPVPSKTEGPTFFDHLLVYPKSRIPHPPPPLFFLDLSSVPPRFFENALFATPRRTRCNPGTAWPLQPPIPYRNRQDSLRVPPFPLPVRYSKDFLPNCDPLS